MKSPASDFDRYLARPTKRRLERVVRDYHALVWRCAYRVTRHADDAEDICQDVFLKLLLEPPPCGSVRSPERYLVWQVLGRAANLRRARERREARESAHVHASAGHMAFEDLDALQQAIAALPDDLRAAIELRYLGGLTTAETAAALGIAERTVEDRLQRGRATLRARLGPISAGAVTFVSVLDGWVDAAPPVQLLPKLLRIGRMGSALAAATSAGTTGGAIGKLALVGSAALLLVASGALVLQGLVGGGEAKHSEEPVVGRVETTRGERPAAAAREAPMTPADAGAGSSSNAARITGIVRDEEDAPVAGAVVRISRWEEEGGDDVLETASDELGEFAIQLPAPGRWAARAWKEGFLFPGRICRMGSGGREEKLSLRLCRPRRLQGSILDASGSSIPGAVLWLSGESVPELDPAPPGESPFAYGVEPWVRVPAGRDGRYDTGFHLAVLGVTDPTRFHAVADGFAIVERRVQRTDFREGEAQLDFTLDREMPVGIVVVDPAGRPIQDAAVGLGSKDSWRYDSRAFRTRTDALGRARLQGLAPSVHEVRAEKENHAASAALVSPGGSTDVVITLHPLGPGVRGRVLFEPGFPQDSRAVQDLVFEVVDEGGEVRRLYSPRGKIDPVSHEFIYWPDPGRYRLRVDLHLLTWTTEPFEYSGREEVRADIHVGFGPPYLAGTVVRAGTTEPVPGVRVLASFREKGQEHRSGWERFTTVNGFRFQEPPGNKRGTETDAKGKFLLLLPRRHSGREIRSTRENVAALLVGSKEKGWAEDVALDFDVGTAIDDLRIELEPPGSVDGIVTEGGEPVNRALVVASDLQGTTLWTQSDREGRYRIDGLRPGSYVVLPLGKAEPSLGGGTGGSDDMNEVPPPHELFDRPVTVNPGDVSRVDLDLERNGPGRVEGTIALELQGSWLTHDLLVNRVPRSIHGLARGERYIRDARFNADFILPGRYRASLLTDFAGEYLADADFEMRPGHVARVHLEPPRGELRLPVTAGGSSPEDLRVCRVHRLMPDGEAEPWRPFYRLEDPGLIRLERLPEGRVKVLVSALGRVARSTEPIAIFPGRETMHSGLELNPGQEIRVRVSTAEPAFAVKKLELWVRESTDGPGIEHTARCEAAAEEQVWVLSAFAPGNYHLEVKAGEPFAPVHVPVELRPGATAEVEIELHLRR